MGPEVLLLLLAGGGLALGAILMNEDDDPAPAPEEDEMRVLGTEAADTITASAEDAAGLSPDGTLIYELGDGGDYYSFGAPYDPPLPDIARLEVYGQDGEDRIAAYAEGIEQLIDGGAGDDVVAGNALVGSNDTLLGGDGNDTLLGTSDSLDGGDGDDLLIARPFWRIEADPDTRATMTTLTGGAGRDIFLSDGDSDWLGDDGSNQMPDVVITDFQPGIDQIYLPPVLSQHHDDADLPHEPQHILSDYYLYQRPEGTVLTALYSPLQEGGGDVLHSITLQGGVMPQPGDIAIGLRVDGQPQAALTPLPGETDAGGQFVHLMPDDRGLFWRLENVESVNADLGAGNDTLIVDGFAQGDSWPYVRGDVIHAGAGDDLIDVTLPGRDNAGGGGATAISDIRGGAGDDTIIADVDEGRLDGGAGDDVIDMMQSHQTIAARDLEPVIALGGTGADRIIMGEGQIADLGADGDADLVELTPYGASVPTGTPPAEIRNMTADDQIVVTVPPDMADLVSAQHSGDQILIHLGTRLIATAAFTGNLPATLIDPGNPDAAIQITSL